MWHPAFMFKVILSEHLGAENILAKNFPNGSDVYTWSIYIQFNFRYTVVILQYLVYRLLFQHWTHGNSWKRESLTECMLFAYKEGGYLNLFLFLPRVLVLILFLSLFFFFIFSNINSTLYLCSFYFHIIQIQTR